MPDMTLKKTQSPKEKLKQIAEQKQKETENSLLKVALTESSENCEGYLKKSAVSLQKAEQNRQKENEQWLSELRQSNAESNRKLNDLSEQYIKQMNELNNSVSKLKNVNQDLSITITTEVDKLINRVQSATVSEVKDSLRETNSAISQATNDFKNKIIMTASEEEERMKDTVRNFKTQTDEMNKALDEKLEEIKSTQREFFMFNSAKQFFFWVSQVVSIVTAGLLIYFIFFKK